MLQLQFEGVSQYGDRGRVNGRRVVVKVNMKDILCRRDLEVDEK